MDCMRREYDMWNAKHTYTDYGVETLQFKGLGLPVEGVPNSTEFCLC
jgi:hypothetical protein